MLRRHLLHFCSWQMHARKNCWAVSDKNLLPHLCYNHSNWNKQTRFVNSLIISSHDLLNQLGRHWQISHNCWPWMALFLLCLVFYLDTYAWAESKKSAPSSDATSSWSKWQLTNLPLMFVGQSLSKPSPLLRLTWWTESQKSAPSSDATTGRTNWQLTNQP